MCFVTLTCMPLSHALNNKNSSRGQCSQASSQIPLTECILKIHSNLSNRYKN